MTGTHGALHHFSHRTKLKHPGVGLGINLLDRREKRYIDPGSLGFSLSASSVRGYVRRSSGLLNWVGLTNTLTTTYIIVGTGPL